MERRLTQWQTLHRSTRACQEKGEKLEIDLDGTEGYATSFLDEAFGGLARKYGKEKVIKSLVFISYEEPYLIDEIKSYMNE